MTAQITTITKKAEPVAVPPAKERSICQITADLSKPVAGRHLSTKKIQNRDIYYISWYHAEQYLDHYAAGWRKEIVAIQHMAGKIAITVRLTIPTLEGDVSRDATGYEDETTKSFGDPFSNAESMAMRRACANFGLGRYLYDK